MFQNSKRFVLLGAIEDLTEKETFRIREGNFEEAVEVQSKKARIIEKLEALDDRETLSSEELDEFNERINRLLNRERENELALQRFKRDNRSELKTLSKYSSSASGIKKAYGSASNPDGKARKLRRQA